MEITADQLQILQSFSCERLSINDNNHSLIGSFENKRNSGLADYLKDYAWKEDAENSVAFYVVKNKENQILFFFSLKCGALFEVLDEEELRSQLDTWLEVKKIL